MKSCQYFPHLLTTSVTILCRISPHNTVSSCECYGNRSRNWGSSINFISVTSTISVGFGCESVQENCAKCCTALASLATIGGEQAVLLLRATIKFICAFALRLYGILKVNMVCYVTAYIIARLIHFIHVALSFKRNIGQSNNSSRTKDASGHVKIHLLTAERLSIYCCQWQYATLQGEYLSSR